MAKLALTIQGKNHSWVWIVEGDPKYLEEWRDDGLEIDEIIIIVPAWWIDMGFSASRYDLISEKSGGYKLSLEE